MPPVCVGPSRNHEVNGSIRLVSCSWGLLHNLTTTYKLLRAAPDVIRLLHMTTTYELLHIILFQVFIKILPYFSLCPPTLTISWAGARLERGRR
jgi:hypothetical protein